MSTIVRTTVTLAAVLVVTGTASAQSLARMDLAAQASLLRLSDPGSTSAGVGARYTFDFGRWVSLDGEINFYPQDNFELVSSAVIDGNLNLAYNRRRSDAFVGLKAGRRGDRLGLFVKARPGVARLVDKGVACAGEVCPLVLLARPEYRTEFALDLGAIVEFYPTARTVARIDVGDVLIRHRSAAPPCNGCTTHNFSTKFGIGLRF
jgi:hypothetical protein